MRCIVVFCLCAMYAIEMYWNNMPMLSELECEALQFDTKHSTADTSFKLYSQHQRTLGVARMLLCLWILRCYLEIIILKN